MISSPTTYQHRSSRRRALWRTWAASAVRQAREAKEAQEPEIAKAFLAAAGLCADAAVAAIRGER